MKLKKLPTTSKLFLSSLATITRKNKPSELKELVLDSNFFLTKIPVDHLEKYKKFIGLNIDGVPLSYLYTLAQRAQLGVLVSKAYPLPIFGMVHIDNELTLIEGIDINSSLELRVSLSFDQDRDAQKLYALLNVSFFQNNTLVGSCKSKYLAYFEKKKSSKKKTEFQLNLEGFEKFRELKFNVSDAQKYAVVSGDFNFIHLHPVLGRLFGFKSSIIHGMCTSAMIMANLENSNTKLTRWQKVSFKRPITLPSSVIFLKNSNKDIKIMCPAYKSLYLEASYNFTI